MENKKILILGAKSDIGIAIANKFALEGYDIQLAGRDVNEIKKIKSDLQKNYSINVEIYDFDVTNYDKFDNFINNLNTLPNIVVCSIGNMPAQNISEINIKIRTNIYKTNFEGPANILSEFANLFAKRSNGTIVGISSVAGARGRSSNYNYGSAKAGFTAFLSGLRNRLYKKNVHVITVLPGPIFTKLTSGMQLVKFLTNTKENLAHDVYNAVIYKKDIIYSLKIWRLIIFIINMIPEKIFKKNI